MNKSNVWQYLKDAILGGQAAPTDAVNIQGVDTTSPEYKENMAGAAADITVSQNPRVGGLIPDIRAGYRENAYNPISMDNLSQSILPDGRKKRTAYRFGEFAGTAARLLDNPLVRGAIAYGLSDRMGDRNPLVEGVTAAVGTQQNRMKDSIYRNSLIEQGQNSLRNTAEFANLDPAEQQAQLDRIANQVNSYRGYLGDDTYKQVLAGMQLRDNAEYRNAMLASQQRNQMLANKLAEDRLEYQKVSDAADRALKSRGLDIQERNIQKGTQKFRTAIGDKDGALQQIQEMKALVKANPKATGYIVGKFAKGQEAGQKFANEFLSRNPEAIKTRAAIAKLRGTTMHDLAGTAQTLQEQRNLAPFLPDATDNAQTILAKLEQLEKELLREKQTLVNTGYELGFDYDNTQPKQQTTTNEGWAF